MSTNRGSLRDKPRITELLEVPLNKSLFGKDFGYGFYLTRDEENAKKFIFTSIKKAIRNNEIKEQTYGYVSSFKLNMKKEDLKVYEFLEATDEWLWFIAKNRKQNLSEKIDKLIDDNIINSDIIIGKIANDITNRTIAGYLNGVFGDIASKDTVKTVLKLLLPNNLDYQFCFKSEKAIQCLEFLEAKKYGI